MNKESIIIEYCNNCANNLYCPFKNVNKEKYCLSLKSYLQGYYKCLEDFGMIFDNNMK